MFLQVELRKQNFKKSWKLEAKEKPFSVGHSRHADIRLDKKHSGIAGVLEFREGQWGYTHLTKPENQTQPRFVPISGPTVIPLIEGELHVAPLDRHIQIFSDNVGAAMGSLSAANASSTATSEQKLWVIWKRNNKVWFSEYYSLNAQVRWPHNRKLAKLSPTIDWQNLESEGLTLSYKLANSPSTKGLFSGSMAGIFDPALRPYLVSATIACLAIGALVLFGKKAELSTLAQIPKAPASSTIIRLEKKPTPPPVKEIVQAPSQPKTAVAKALEQAQVPKMNSAQPKMRRALGQVFSQIGKHSLKSLSVGSGPKTIAITNTTVPALVPTSAKTFKVLGSLGTGTGLQPSQFAKGNGKGAPGLNAGPIGGSNLGQISQGNIGQGDLGLMHKESEVSGGLDREVIAKYINSQKGKILFCYERQLSANPGMFGKVSVKFQIASGGEVETSKITESTLNNSNVESCLLQLMATWRFPKPTGGVKVLVSYPFVFKSLN